MTARYRVTFEFEARDDREAVALIQTPEHLWYEASSMRFENLSQWSTLRMVTLVSIPVGILATVGYKMAQTWFGA